MSEMTAELIERLERGETGWEIDSAVHWMFSEWRNIGGGWREHKQTGKQEQFNYGVYPEVSTSLDAAIALVERVRPGLFWAVAKEHPDFLREGEHLCSASVYGAVEWSSHEGYPEPHIPSSDARAPTPAAALIAALLKAEAK